MKTLFTVTRRKAKLPPAWTVVWHPFVADDDGISCRMCCLPRANYRHGDRQAA